jgi:hypothetical protein
VELPIRLRRKPIKIKKTFVVVVKCMVDCYKEEWSLNGKAIKCAIQENLPYAKIKVVYVPNNKRKRRKRKAKNT